MLKKIYKENPYIGLLLIFIVLVLFMFLEMKNHRFQLVDFEVYYKAAQRVISGDNLYRAEDGFYKYKYSPVAATYFLPFISFSLKISKIVFWIFSAIVITSLLYINTKLAYYGKKAEPGIINTITLLCGLFLAVHYMLDIHLGQVNFLLFTMYSLSVLFYIRQKELVWPFILALSIFIKPFAIIFIPYLVLKRKFKQIAFLFIFLLLLAALPLLFYNISDLLAQYQGWFVELAVELKNKQSLMSDSNHTIFSILARNRPLSFFEFGSTGTIIFQSIILSGIIFFVLWFAEKGKNLKHPEIADFALLTGIIPLLAFTDINSFGAISLMLCLLLSNFSQMNRFEKIILIIGVILTSLNIYDLWGAKWFGIFKSLSVISFGTIFLVFSLAILRKKQIT